MTKINLLKKLIIGGVEQWILIRGKDVTNPPLLFLQAGPGFPIIHEANEIQKNLQLEENYVCIYWDQRGCGKSFSHNLDPASMTLQRMVSDVHEMIENLKSFLHAKKVFSMGFSVGGTVLLISAFQKPESFESIFVVGPDIVMAEAELNAYKFIMQKAHELNNKKAKKELEKIGEPPHTDFKKFQTRVKWLTNFKGINQYENYSSLLLKTIKSILLSKEYSFYDLIKTIRGMNFSQKYLLRDYSKINLLKTLNVLKVPVYFFQGARDEAAPAEILERYFNHLMAERKRLFVFENSAHMPQYEESVQFRKTILSCYRL